MKKKTSKLILIIPLVLVVFLILFFNFREDNERSIKFNQDRVFSKELNLIKSYPMDKRYSVMRHSANNLYFVNWGSGQIFEFNKKDLKLNKTYGSKGEGPKENLLISRFDIDDNTYSVVDTKKHTIQVVTFDDSLLYYYKYPKPLLRSSKVGENYLFAGWDIDFNITFEKFNLLNKITTKITVDDQRFVGKEKTGLLYDGFFVKNNFHEAFVSYSNDAIFCFDKDLNYLYSMDMVYDIPDPRYEKLSDGNSYPSKDNYNCTEAAFLDENNLMFLLTTDTDKNYKETRIIDVYNLIQKKYLYSIIVKNIDGYPPEEILKEKNTMYVLYENAVVKYTINDK